MICVSVDLPPLRYLNLMDAQLENADLEWIGRAFFFSSFLLCLLCLLFLVVCALLSHCE